MSVNEEIKVSDSQLESALNLIKQHIYSQDHPMFDEHRAQSQDLHSAVQLIVKAVRAHGLLSPDRNRRPFDGGPGSGRSYFPETYRGR